MIMKRTTTLLALTLIAAAIGAAGSPQASSQERSDHVALSQEGRLVRCL
jgi:hypothetical protein